HDGFISAIRESNRAFEERLFEQRSRQLLRLAGAGLIALVIAALIGVFVINQRANNARQREKDRAAVAAAQAKELAAAAKVDSLVAGSRLAFNKGDTPAAIALAQEAIKESWKLGLENQNDLYSLLVKVAYAPGPRQQFGEPGGSYFGGQVAVSPGGTTVLYTLGVDGSKVASALIALDLASGEERRFEQSSQVRDIVFLDEGRALVGYERVLEIFDLATGAAQPLTALPANEFLYSFAVGPGGTKAAAAVCRDVSLDGTLCKQGSLLVLDLESDQILRSLGNNTLTISSVAYSPNGATVLSGECVGANDDPTVKSEPCPQGILTLWDIKTGVPVQLPVGPGAITNIAVSPNGTRALVSVDQTLQYWNLESGDLLDVLQAHTSRVNAVTISRDGLHALSAGDSIIWWDLTTRQPLERLTPGDTEIWDVAFGANDQTALSVQYDGTLVWWDLLPGSQLKQFQGPGGPTLPLTVAASVDAQTVVYGAGNLPLLVWDAASQQVMQVFPQSEDPMEHVALSANGRMLTRTSGGVITLWDATTASELVSLIRSGSVSSLALNASGDLGIVGFSTGILGTLDFTNESVPSQTFAAEDRNSRVTALAIYESPGDVEQSVQVATGWCITQACDQSRVSRRVLDGESWQLGTYNGEVTSLAFSVDGQILAVGLSSGSVVLLDIAAGTELHRFEAHTDPVISLSFREDNRALLSGSSKNVWIMWRFDDTLENLHEWASQRRYVPVLSCVLRHVYDVECPVPITVGALPTGSPVTGSLVANDSQSWVFDGAKDRPVTIQVMDAYARNGLAEDTILILFGPDGTELAFQRLDTITETKLILTVDLPETGQYKAAIYTGDTGLEYTLQLTDLTLTTPTPLPTARARSSLTPTPDEQLSFTPTLLISPTSTLSPTPLPSRPIMWGQTVTGTLDVGQQENWSFQANAQDTISIMLYWDTPNWEPSLTLYTADNRIVDLRYGDSQAQQVGMERVRLPDTGTYIVSVKNKVEVTGSYRLVLTNLVLTTATPDPSIAMQQQQQPLSQAAQQQVYQQQVVVMPPLALELPPVTLTPLAPAVWAAAQVGPNAGAIPVGDRAVWTYTGCAGERLALSVMAAYPINSTALADIQPGMLDPAVVLYGPDGAVLAQADDIDFLVNTDARIEFVTLPAAGVYEIEVSGSSLQTGGAYTLTIESDRSACSG
ncbi:MAG: hypothetical protein JXQ72_09965, partial [Anaerolineae bacterium]|nr:hypothetical protein [Anaerolineae bacterium]